MRKEESLHSTADKLDIVIRLLEDLFILEAASAGFSRDAIRRVISVDNNRISRVSMGLAGKKKRAKKSSS